jgi:hypothetical protein
MNKLLLAGLALSLSACGGTDWAGSYTGPASQSGSCSDGSSVPNSSASTTLNITESGDTITWTAGCGATVTATPNGNIATVKQYSCPAITTNGSTTALTVNSGTLTLTGNSLALDLIGTATVSGAATGTCNIHVTGTLAKAAK